MNTLKDGTEINRKGLVNMDKTSDTKDKFDRLVEAVLDLESKVLQLESDIYDMQRVNNDMRRRVNDLESLKRIPPF